jgi:hypothetical protein
MSHMPRHFPVFFIIIGMLQIAAFVFYSHHDLSPAQLETLQLQFTKNLGPLYIILCSLDEI